jgi:DnaJ-class molecular chaperone
MPQQPETGGHQPLMEPAVLVTENCPDCRGTGVGADEPCPMCEGSGRVVSEVPMSVAYAQMQACAARATAPPPSMLRQQGSDA